MKLVTFEANGKEAWGFVLDNPADGRAWVFEPAKVDKELQLSASMTSGYSVSMPKFMPDSKWPETLCDFLKLEDEGMDVLKRLETFLSRFLEQSDPARMTFAGFPLDDVSLKAPIPQPRLMWGLVQNCPTFIRSNPTRHSTNLFPQGHQRPCGAVSGNGQIFYHPIGAGEFGWNVELGVIIGKKGRYIPVDKALDYVAGYTVVIDSQINGYHSLMDKENLGNYDIAAKHDWYVGATCSWGGKMADAHCSVGPYLVTKDEIGNVYDLLVYTKMKGMLRDRASTGAMLLGVERTIQWYSSFATLYPGDIIHMGTVGTDGLRLSPGSCYNGKDCTIESEIEKIGTVKSPVLNLNYGDWREDDDETKTIHISSAVRDVIKSGKETVSLDDWSLDKTRHFWTLFKNYKNVKEQEGIHLLETPRFLCAPNSALGISGNEVEIPKRANNLEISVELGVVLKKITGQVKKGTADDYVLGYTPLISITDSSFDDILLEPTTLQEKGLPLVYGRWADGFNTILKKPVSAKWADVSNLVMNLEVEGIGTAKGNTNEYYADIDKALSFMTTYITLFPGDVITMGCISDRIIIPNEKIKDGLKIKASIEKLGEIELTLKKSVAEDNSGAVNILKL